MELKLIVLIVLNKKKIFRNDFKNFVKKSKVKLCRKNDLLYLRFIFKLARNEKKTKQNIDLDNNYNNFAS